MSAPTVLVPKTLKPNHIKLLDAIQKQREGCFVREVRESEGVPRMSRQAMRGYIERLERYGLLKPREKNQQRTIALSEMGKEVLRQIKAA